MEIERNIVDLFLTCYYVVSLVFNYICFLMETVFSIILILLFSTVEGLFSGAIQIFDLVLVKYVELPDSESMIDGL